MDERRIREIMKKKAWMVDACRALNEVGGAASAEEVGSAVGVSGRRARDILMECLVAGFVTVEPSRSLGSAGRLPARYALTGDGATLASVRIVFGGHL
jgi:predicted ArsR family transcriptional regulator